MNLTEAMLELTFQRLDLLSYDLYDNGFYNDEQVLALEAIITIAIRPKKHYPEIVKTIELIFNDVLNGTISVDADVKDKFTALNSKFRSQVTAIRSAA